MAKKKTSNRWRHPTRKYCYCFKRPDSDYVYTSIHGKRESTDLIWDSVNKDEAMEILNLRIQEYESPDYKKDKTINDLTDQYSKVYFHNYSKVQKSRYNNAIRYFLKRNHNLNDILEIRNDISRNLKDLNEKYSPPYVHKLLTCLRKIFAFGVEEEMISRNPVKKAMFPQGGKRARKLFFDKKEIETLINYSSEKHGKEFADLIEFISIFGTRIAEPLGGHRKDIDLETNQLLIRDFKRANKRLGEEFYPRYIDISIFDNYTKASKLLERILSRDNGKHYFKWRTYAKLELWLRNDMKVLGMYQRNRSFHAIRKYAENEFINQGYPVNFGAMFFGHTEAVMRKHYLEVLGPKKFREIVKNTLKNME